MPHRDRPLYAVLIDADNIPAKFARAMLKEITVLGVVLGAIGALAGPGSAATAINPAAPASFRPLALEASGFRHDVHPSEIKELSLAQGIGGRSVLYLSFGPEVTQWLAAATGAHAGEPMAILLCGTELMAPLIRAPILSGQVQISGGLEPGEMRTALAVIAGQIDCEGNLMVTAAETGSPRRRDGGGN